MSTAALESPDIASLALNDKDSTLRWLDGALSELQVMRRLVAEGDEERLSLILEDVVFDRQRWIDDRTKNAWAGEDSDATDYGGAGIGAQLFGFRRGSSKKDKK